MRTLNRVMIIGHLAADPEMRQTKSGHTMVNFAVATNRIIYEDNRKREMTDFHRIIVWSKLAEVCSQYLIKGMAVFLEGRLANRSFEDKDGNKQYRTEVILESLIILTWKKGLSGENQVELQSIDNKENEVVDFVQEKEELLAV